MEITTKSSEIKNQKPMKSLLITWVDLPGFILEFPYYSIMCKESFDIHKKDTILMAMSKMTSFYKHTIYGYTMTDLSKTNVPRLYWNYENKYGEYKRGIYNFMMETLRMIIIPRLHEIPKL